MIFCQFYADVFMCNFADYLQYTEQFGRAEVIRGAAYIPGRPCPLPKVKHGGGSIMV